MSGRNIEPFPRGVLVAQAGAVTSYYSEPYDVGEAKSLAYWFEVLSSHPASVTDPATGYIETSNALGFHDWANMTPGGIAPADFNTPLTGSVEDPMRFIRARIDVTAGEAPLLEFRIVARDR